MYSIPAVTVCYMQSICDVLHLCYAQILYYIGIYDENDFYFFKKINKSNNNNKINVNRGTF